MHRKHRSYLAFIKEIFEILGYVLYRKKLNTLKHGIPQSRNRVYIVAIRADCKTEKFQWPEEQSFSKNWLKVFLYTSEKGNEKLKIQHYEDKYGRTAIWKNKAYILDIGSSEGFQSAKPDRCPCLTRSRLGGVQSGYYIPRLCRRLNVREAAKMQGVPSQLVVPLVKATSDKIVRSALGDSMSVNVLGQVIRASLVAIGKINPSEVSNPWDAQALSQQKATGQTVSDVRFEYFLRARKS